MGVVMHDVHYVSKINENLLSLRQIGEDSFRLTFKNQTRIRQNPRGSLLMTVAMKGRCFNWRPKSEHALSGLVTVYH